MRGIHARSGGHPLRDAAAKSDAVAVHTVTVADAVADTVFGHLYADDIDGCDDSSGHHTGTGQQL
jgi:hypothetical protein